MKSVESIWFRAFCLRLLVLVAEYPRRGLLDARGPPIIVADKKLLASDFPMSQEQLSCEESALQKRREQYYGDATHESRGWCFLTYSLDSWR